MKKFVVISLSVLLVLGLAGSALAAHLEVTGDGVGMSLNGEAIVRGVYQDWDNDNETRFWDQRFRLILGAQVTDGVKVVHRFTTSYGEWDGAAQTGGSVNTDWAYLQIDMFGGTYFIGRQPANWGLKFMVWGAIKDRFKAVYKMGDATVGAFLQKDREDTGAGSFAKLSDTDKDSYSVFYIGKAGDAKFGVIGVYTKDSVSDDSGFTVDAHFSTAMSGIAIMGEVAYLGGDLNEASSTSGDDAKYGMFVAAKFDLDAISLTGAVAYAANGYTADDDFTPTLLLGTTFANSGAIANFGSMQTAGDTDSAYAALANAEFAAGEGMNVGGTLAYYCASSEADDATLIEIDAYMTYALAKNTNWKLGLSYAITGDDINGGDAIMVLSHRFVVNF